jgi:hypothetical protein
VLLFERHSPLLGFSVLTKGWAGVLTGDIAWFANIFFFLCVCAYLFRLFWSSLILSLAALAIGLLSLRATAWWFNEGSSTQIVGLGSGFYVWLASFLVIGASAALALAIRRDVV